MTENNHDLPRLDTPLLTPAEAARLLAVRPSWTYEAVRAGTLPCLRLGRHIRFNAADARGLAAGKSGVARPGSRFGADSQRSRRRSGRVVPACPGDPLGAARRVGSVR
jgi:excisionase family DNA binding protein